MIGEPTMEDGADDGPSGDVLSDSGEAAWAGRGRRPWLWAVGGIVVASAVWAAVLHGRGDAGPNLHGYHLGSNPCTGDALTPLKAAVGKQGFVASRAAVSRGPALDKLSCYLSTASQVGDGWATTYSISVSIELHKKTDPRAEFEDTRHARVSSLPGGTDPDAPGDTALALAVSDFGFSSGADARSVPGIGDEAYLLSSRTAGQALAVLHGGAVLTLRISGYTDWNSTDPSAAAPGEPKAPDLAPLRPAMTDAMRDLMASLAS